MPSAVSAGNLGRCIAERKKNVAGQFSKDKPVNKKEAMAKIIKKDRRTKAREKPALERIVPAAKNSVGSGRKVIKAAKPKVEPSADEAADADLLTLPADDFAEQDETAHDAAAEDLPADFFAEDDKQETLSNSSDAGIADIEYPEPDDDLLASDPEMLRDDWDRTAAAERPPTESEGTEQGENDDVIAEAEADWAERGGLNNEAFSSVESSKEGSALHRILPHDRETEVHPEQRSEGSSLHRMPVPNKGTAISRGPNRQGSGLHKTTPPQSDMGDLGGNAAYRRMQIDAQQAIKKSDPKKISSDKKREKAPPKITPRWPQARDSSEGENKARAILENANRDAEKLKQKVETEIAEAIASEHARGLADGLQQTQVLQEKVRQLAEGLQREVEGQALETSVKIARRLLEEELDNNAEAIVSVVRQALDSARQQREIFVRVNPVHIEVLRENKSSIIDALGRARDLDFREDPDLAPGGCMVETEVGTIDARLSTQFDALALQLTGGH